MPATRREAAALLVLLALAATVRLHDLGSQLWLDEMDAVRESIRRPALEILTRWPATTSHVLYDLSGHAARRLLGESAFALRLPAALFGVAGVAALVAFTRPALGGRVALVAGALLAVSYHHVFYSQNARGYTGLLLFALVASAAFRRLRTGPGGRGSLALYATAAALGAYTLVLGVFVTAGHALVAGVAAPWARARGRPSPVAVRAALTATTLAAALTALLYAPFAAHLVRFTRQQAALPSATAVHAGPVARLGVAAEGVEGLSRGLGGRPGLCAAALLAAAGLVRWARRDALSLSLLAAPLAVELGALLAADVPLAPRYFALALAPLAVAVAAGTVWLADAVAAAAPSPARRPLADLLPAALVAVAALPLAAYYHVPKQDFRGAIDQVARLARDGDGRIAVHYAARGICGYYGAPFQDVQALADLERAERGGRRLWVVTTLERFLAAEAPALHAHIQASYRRVEVLPGTVGGAEMTIYERDARF
jgi:mannosyltransferase